MTIAEKWEHALNNADEDERDDALAAMYEEHMMSYTSRDGTQYILFEDDSVHSEDGFSFTKAELLEGSEASPAEGVPDIFDGVIRTFWPTALTEIGDMGLLFDKKEFSAYAAERTYFFTFSAWQRREQAGHIEYTVDVLASRNRKIGNNSLAKLEFTLRLSHSDSSDDFDVNYSVMPSPEPGASWNNPVRWQEIVNEMELYCASVE